MAHLFACGHGNILSLCFEKSLLTVLCYFCSLVKNSLSINVWSISGLLNTLCRGFSLTLSHSYVITLNCKELSFASLRVMYWCNFDSCSRNCLHL